MGFEPYLDKHDIAAGEDWEARLGRLIESADTVVFEGFHGNQHTERSAQVCADQTQAAKRFNVSRRTVQKAREPRNISRLIASCHPV
jgi:hypothetical protein